LAVPSTRRSFLTGLIACPTCAALARAEEHPHWSYEGTTGPSAWGKLEADYGACALGTQQSPIDLTGAVKAQIQPLIFNWKPQAFSVVNNGHTIQANVAPGSTLTLDGQRYELKQFHFHTPSEHTINGKRFQMEAHFVHADASGLLAVVGVLMRPGKVNPAFKAIMAAAPTKAGKPLISTQLDPNQFLPKDRALFRYEGSLTTPPCAETVNWNVFAKEIEAASSDMDAFHALFAMNARPLQPVNRRFLLRGF
jgi:carbonic anhydrase